MSSSRKPEAGNGKLRRWLLHLRVEQRDQTRGETLQVFSRGPALWRAQSRVHRLLIVKIYLGDQVIWRLAPAQHAGNAPEFHLPQAGPPADEGHVRVPIMTVECGRIWRLLKQSNELN